MYTIQPYSYKQAKKLGVTILPSVSEGKKIDVYKNGLKICSIGDYSFKMDFLTYMKANGKAYARERCRLYHIRNKKDNIKGTRGWYALNILW